MSVRRGIVLALVTLLVLGAVTGALLRLYGRGDTIISAPVDFLAFDCAAKVAARGADPYLAEPLRSCERDALAEAGVRIVTNLVVPAPLPPYALAALAPLALVSFLGASAFWFALGFCAVAASLVMLHRITRAPLAVIALTLIGADALPSLAIGQVVPLLLALLCGSAAALQAGRPRLAAAFAFPLMLEPHVGLPVTVALFVWEPRARRVLLAGVALLAGLSLVHGVAPNVEYLTVVLPAQAHGEGLEFGGQYGLSALLAAYGVAPPLALALGTASYLTMFALALALAPRVARALDDPAALLFVPAAFVLLGGAYVHAHQMAFALPLALLLLGRVPRVRALAAVALLALAIPWETLAEIPGIGAAHAPPSKADVAAQLARVAGPNLPAETAWGVWVRSGVRDSRTTGERLALKIPIWLGLLVLAGATLQLTRLPRRTDLLAA